MSGIPVPDRWPPLSRADEKLLGKLENKKYREETGLFPVEGIRLVEEALRCGLSFKWAGVTLDPQETGSESALRAMALIDRLRSAGVKIFLVEKRAVKRETDLTTPQSLIAVCRIPVRQVEEWSVPEYALVAVCDRLNNPGNLGSLVRVAAAAGVDAVLLTPGTVDPWNPKCVRGAMGALFRLPVFAMSTQAGLAGFLQRNGFTTYVAASGGEDCFKLESFPARSAIVFGSEAHGAGGLPGLETAPRISIPMSAGVESLNVAVAAGIVLYRIKQASGHRPQASGKTKNRRL